VTCGLSIVLWRLVVDGSILQGRASWTFGVWVESLAYALIVAGALRALAIRDGRADEAFLGRYRLLVLGVFPLAFLFNLAVGELRGTPKVEGGLDARLEVLKKIADACKRTAKDEQSCNQCCEGGNVFTDTCECIVPWHCKEGDESVKACRSCCTRDGETDMTFELVHNQGCVCNMDDSLYE
jgi:hypothetical protein